MLEACLRIFKIITSNVFTWVSTLQLMLAFIAEKKEKKTPQIILSPNYLFFKKMGYGSQQ